MAGSLPAQRCKNSPAQGFNAINDRVDAISFKHQASEAESTEKSPVIQAGSGHLKRSHGSLISDHLRLGSDEIESILADLPHQAKKRKNTSTRGPKKQKTISPVGAGPHAEQYTEDPPGVIRPLTPPLTRRAVAVKSQKSNAVTTLPRYNVTKPGAVRIRSATNVKDAIRCADAEIHTGNDAYLNSCKSATFDNVQASTLSHNHRDSLQAHVNAETAPGTRDQVDTLIYHPDIGLVTKEQFEEVIAATRQEPLDDLEDDDFIDANSSLLEEPPGKWSTAGNTKDSDSYDTSDIDDELMQSFGNVPAGPTISPSFSLGLPTPANSNVKAEAPDKCLKAQDTAVAAPTDQVADEDLLGSDSDFSINDVSSGPKAQPTQASAPLVVDLEDYGLDSDSELADAATEVSTALKGISTTFAPPTTPVTAPISDNPQDLPIQRPSFPTPARDRSPIVGMNPSNMLRTHFRIGPALNTGCAAARSTNPNGIIIELYASVVSSARDSKLSTQEFVLADMYHPNKPPYINATFKGWKGSELWERECAMFLGEGGKGKLCRCLGQMKREGGGKIGKWVFELKSLWEADRDDVAYVAGIVCG